MALPLQLQQNHAEQWLHCVRQAFEDFDTDHDGVIALEEIIACLRSKLPPQEVGASLVPVRMTPMLQVAKLSAGKLQLLCGVV